MMSFNEFIHKHKLKNEAASNSKIYQVLSFFSLNDIGIYLRDGPFKTNIGFVNQNPFRGTHWVSYMNEIFLFIWLCPTSKII